jgi:hypothetical protein
LCEAENADRRARAHQRALRARIVGAVGESAIATTLAMRADEATRDTTSGAVAKLGAEITVLEQQVGLDSIDKSLRRRSAASAPNSSDANVGYLMQGRRSGFCRPLPEGV